MPNHKGVPNTSQPFDSEANRHTPRIQDRNTNSSVTGPCSSALQPQSRRIMRWHHSELDAKPPHTTQSRVTSLQLWAGAVPFPRPRSRATHRNVVPQLYQPPSHWARREQIPAQQSRKQRTSKQHRYTRVRRPSAPKLQTQHVRRIAYLPSALSSQRSLEVNAPDSSIRGLRLHTPSRWRGT